MIEFMLSLLNLQELYKETGIDLCFMKDYDSITVRVGYKDKAVCHTFSAYDIVYTVSNNILLEQIYIMIEQVRED